MRGGYRTHAHLARALHPIQATDACITQRSAPGGVGKNHQLGDQGIQRTATLALDDLYYPRFVNAGHIAAALPINFKVVIFSIPALPGFTASGLQHLGEFPQQLEFHFVGEFAQSSG